MDNPYILEETDDFAVVYKPSRMHCASAKNFTWNSFSANQREPAQTKEREQNTLFDWYAGSFSAGAKQCFEEVELMHRLDFETHGLVLFAKNKKSFNFFRDLQDKGEFIKEYSAVCVPADSSDSIEGFPNLNFAPSCLCEIKVENTLSGKIPFVIESYFRPYGPGRKSVRPVIEDGKKYKEIAKDKDGFYQTEIVNINGNIFTARIKRGFRHQIRCHLCWIGCPIKNDSLYSLRGASDEKLALRAFALFFTDPASEKLKEYNISQFESN